MQVSEHSSTQTVGSRPGEWITHIQQHHSKAETAVTDVHSFANADEKFQLMPTSI